MVSGGFPCGCMCDESCDAMAGEVSVYLMRDTGLAAMTNLVISTNKGSEATEVYSSPDTFSDCTYAAAYL